MRIHFLNIITMIIMIIVIGLLLNPSIANNYKENDNPCYVLVYDTLVNSEVSGDENFFQYLLIDTCFSGMRYKIIDTFYSANDMKFHDSEKMYGITCINNRCFLLIYNLSNNFSIDTFFIWDTTKCNFSLPAGIGYVIDIKDSILAFTVMELSNDKIPFINTCYVTKVRSINSLDTIKTIPGVLYPVFTLDFEEILFTAGFLCKTDTTIKYENILIYNIKKDSLYKPLPSECVEIFGPRKLSWDTPLFYQKFDTLIMRWNIWKYSEDAGESKRTSFSNSESLLDFDLTTDSLLIYWVRNVINGDTIIEKRTQSIF